MTQCMHSTWTANSNYGMWPTIQTLGFFLLPSPPPTPREMLSPDTFGPTGPLTSPPHSDNFPGGENFPGWKPLQTQKNDRSIFGRLFLLGAGWPLFRAWQSQNHNPVFGGFGCYSMSPKQAWLGISNKYIVNPYFGTLNYYWLVFAMLQKDTNGMNRTTIFLIGK